MNNKKKIQYLLIVILACFALLMLYRVIKPQQNVNNSIIQYLKATVLSVEEVDNVDQYGHHREQNTELRLTNGPNSGQRIGLLNILSANPQDFDSILSPGDKVILSADSKDGISTYQFSDYDRLPYFIILLSIFVGGLIFWGRMIGLKSLIAICITLIVLWQWFFSFVLTPNTNIYTLALVFCGTVSIFVLLIVGGSTKKTWAALLGTWGGLGFASILSYFAIQLMHLTGIETEEAFSLKANIAPYLDFHGVLFASMIIGSLGAMLDVTISIASAQLEMYQSSPKITRGELYKRGMNVGKDIMGAMSNTLILAYIGSSLPLLLYFAADKHVQLERVLNYSMVITELVRAIIGSIGLIYAIPLTAFIMSFMICSKRKRPPRIGQPDV